MDAARALSRNGSGETRKCCMHVFKIRRRVGIVFVAGHARDNGVCDFLDLLIALVRESHKNSDVICGHDASSFCLTVDVRSVSATIPMPARLL